MGENPPADKGLWVDIQQVSPVRLQIQVDCAPGKTLALFGSSGSGKTSTLRAIAGLNQPVSGQIYIDGEPWFDAARRIRLPPQQRSVGYVFQEYALFPHFNALENVMSAMGHLPAATRAEKARLLLAKVKLAELEGRRPAELSGGQRQRVAVARALARSPRVLLLDEPFSAVDAGVRKSLYHELAELRRSLSIPIVLVTHDFQEVLRFADTVAVIEQGKVIAHGSIDELSRRTDILSLQDQSDIASAFDARVTARHEDRGLMELAIDQERILAPMMNIPLGARVRVRVPAREIVLAREPVAGVSIHNQLGGTVAAVVHQSDTQTAAVHVSIGSTTVVAHVTRDAIRNLSLSKGSPVCVLIKSVAIDTL